MLSTYRGQHLLIDAGATNVEALLDLSIGTSCLTEIANRISMTIVMPATGVQFPFDESRKDTSGEDDTFDGEMDQQSGYSAFVLLAESHISIHTFPESNLLTFDCFSCAAFDSTVALQVLEEVYGVCDGRVQVIQRQFEQTDSPVPMASERTERDTERP